MAEADTRKVMSKRQGNVGYICGVRYDRPSTRDI
jgi:hypothetical protein